jgi:hypothetical protein
MCFSGECRDRDESDAPAASLHPPEASSLLANRQRSLGHGPFLTRSKGRVLERILQEEAYGPEVVKSNYKFRIPETEPISNKVH